MKCGTSLSQKRPSRQRLERFQVRCCWVSNGPCGAASKHTSADARNGPEAARSARAAGLRADVQIDRDAVGHVGNEQLVVLAVEADAAHLAAVDLAVVE